MVEVAPACVIGDEGNVDDVIGGGSWRIDVDKGRVHVVEHIYRGHVIRLDGAVGEAGRRRSTAGVSSSFSVRAGHSRPGGGDGPNPGAGGSTTRTDAEPEAKGGALA